MDRSLGSHIVPDALRNAGWELETMDERYGADVSQLIQDTLWIEEATDRGDVILCKDLRIARNRLEAAVINRRLARAFGLARRDIDGPTMARCFLNNEQRIFRMARHAAGPYVVSVSEEGLRRVRLNLQ
jgi:PIN like domain